MSDRCSSILIVLVILVVLVLTVQRSRVAWCWTRSRCRTTGLADELQLGDEYRGDGAWALAGRSMGADGLVETLDGKGREVGLSQEGGTCAVALGALDPVDTRVPSYEMARRGGGVVRLAEVDDPSIWGPLDQAESMDRVQTRPLSSEGL